MYQSRLLALLNDVKNHPANDFLRLALADWLEEHGRSEVERSRAAFIRLQCRLASLSADDPTRKELEAQEERLRRAHEAIWLEDWPRWVTGCPGAEGWWFSRGLLRLRLTGVDWLDEVAADKPTWAWVDFLMLLALLPADVERLAASAVLEQLNHLCLQPGAQVCGKLLGPDGARALAASPHLRRLTALILFDCLIGPEGAKALAAAPSLGSLTTLDLSGLDWGYPNDIENEGVQALARSPYLTGLTHLYLNENRIGDEGAEALADSASLSGLVYLDLRGNAIGLPGARALARSPHLARLTYLGLGGYSFVDPAPVREAAETLLSSPHLPNLTCVDFDYPYSLIADAETMTAFQQQFGNRVVLGKG
jgi:uncharacterized protein (TIGR02996 family)